MRAKTHWNEADKTATVISDHDRISVHDIGANLLAEAAAGRATIEWVRNGVRRHLDSATVRGLHHGYIEGCKVVLADRLADVLATGHIIYWDWLTDAQAEQEGTRCCHADD